MFVNWNSAGGLALSKAEKFPNYGKTWQRDELILAFDLYCRIPFSKATSKNPGVQALARLVGRSPAAVSRKLGNFGSFDPALHKRNISGLPHVGKMDREIWEEFHQDWNALVQEAQRIRERLGQGHPLPDTLESPEGPSEKVVSRKERLHQKFFREAVLSAYEYRCCITGISVPACLTASHIVPWKEAPRLRANPSNGLCLSATFHCLFDAGLLTIQPGFRIRVSEAVLGASDPPTMRHIASFHDKTATKPSRFVPADECLEWHVQHVFQR